MSQLHEEKLKGKCRGRNGNAKRTKIKELNLSEVKWSPLIKSQEDVDVKDQFFTYQTAGREKQKERKFRRMRGRNPQQKKKLSPKVPNGGRLMMNGRRTERRREEIERKEQHERQMANNKRSYPPTALGQG
ncbi:hypothetical protein RUM43_009756 [Polyplax serrata]|uniref:Uncharacterized protein n=1 Tax=Polyplax serrata TaxID=468196 RepID=A0AAN8P6L1_POLSC